MKKITLLLLLLLSYSCTEKSSTPTEPITTYYEGFKNSDYEKIKRTLADSLVTTAGDYIMEFSRKSYYEKFKWDSIFKPEYELIAIDTKGKYPVATVTVRSSKLAFLKNNPLTCNYRFHLESGKIFKIDELDCPDADWVLWQKQVNSLVNWVAKNHPEMDDFVNDLTMEGALNYVKAIALYQHSENAKQP
ncbi:hypothetical protein [Maribacter aestuarii]|uniref:hypothetical protein n=1 Tax=Maribacter aestuarii TaxID=1130723 RepID=UPI00248BA9A9|nr:hypothetical protein [Maribacter aestuarii]